MKKQSLWILCSLALIFVIVATIHAQGVLKESGNTPEQVVSARKFAMRALGSNVGDLRSKIKSGNIKGIAANARSLAALATFLPWSYKEAYTNVYPVKGSKYFYKAEIPDVGAAFEDLRAEAEKLMALAAGDDKPGVESQVRNVLGACGACHKPARGSY